MFICKVNEPSPLQVTVCRGARAKTRNLGRAGAGKGKGQTRPQASLILRKCPCPQKRPPGRLADAQEASQAALSQSHARGGGRLIGSPAFRRL